MGSPGAGKVAVLMVLGEKGQVRPDLGMQRRAQIGNLVTHENGQ